MTATTTDKLTMTKRRFASWRRSRTHVRAATPEALWEMAIDLCRDHKVAEVSRELGINASKLGERAGVVARAKPKKQVARVSRARAEKKSAFVSLSLDRHSSVIPSEDVEYEWSRPDGAKLRVRSSSSKLTSIVASFLAAEPS